MMGRAEKDMERWWRNLENGLKTLLLEAAYEEISIDRDTTVGELLKIIDKKLTKKEEE